MGTSKDYFVLHQHPQNIVTIHGLLQGKAKHIFVSARGVSILEIRTFIESC